MRIKPKTFLAVACLLLLAGGLLLFFREQPQAQGTPAPPKPPEVGVVTLAPQRVELDSVLSGRTNAYLIAEVRPQVGGIIQKRLFVEGAEVKAGQALYQIDPASYRAALDSAKAALAKSEANLFAARLKADRYKDLVAIKAVSQQNYDDAFAALKQAEADVAANQAALETARINLDYTRVTSPIAGRIGRSSVTPGALVTANQATSLATVTQLDPMYVDVTQSSTAMLRLKRQLASGQIKTLAPGKAKARLILEDRSSYPLEGQVQFSEVTVDQSTGTVTLRAVFPNPKNELLPGMYVRAVLETGIDERAILVPQQAVMRNQKAEAIVMVVNQEGKVEQRTLDLGRSVGNQWLVYSGLAAGERVIVEGLQKVKPGATVEGVEIKSLGTPAEASPVKQ